MLSNNDIDISSFPSVVPLLNDITVRFFDFDYLINLKSVTIVIFVVFSVKVIFQFALVWISAKIAKNAQHFYAVQLFKSYINKRYKFHQKNSPSILFRNITAEVSNFATTILFGLLSVFVEISILLAMFIFIFFIEPQIMYVILILILIIVTVYSGSKKILLLYGDKRAIFEDKRIAILKSSLENIKDIIVYDLAKVFSDNLSYTNYNLQFAAYIQRLVTSIPRYLFEITGVFILVITIFLFGDNEQGDTFKIIGIFLLAAFRAMPSISKILSTSQQFTYFGPSLKIIHKELSKNLKIKINNKLNKNIIELIKNISIVNVSYSYPSDQKTKKINLLNNINVSFKKGDKVGITGESGFGKSTIADLLLGLITPLKGKIKIDGKDLNEKNSHQWRKKIGYVGQKVNLLSSGIKENIILDQKFDKTKFNEIIDKCGLKNLYNKRSYEKNLNNQMTNKISGGETQRIGIARALYQSPDILVLDEATNALDFKTEKKILKYIYSIKNNTLFIIAHNDRALFGCNKILNFYQKGKVKLNKI